MNLFNYKSGKKLTNIQMRIVRIVCKIQIYLPIVIVMAIGLLGIISVTYVITHFVVKYW